MINDTQYKKLKQEFNSTSEVGLSAMRSGMNRKTASKYLALNKLPSTNKPDRTWRTRTDPFADNQKAIEEILERIPQIEAKTLFEELNEKDSGKYKNGQLRTLQRKLKRWRLKHGPEKEICFPQEIPPGKYMQADWTDMNELKITIMGNEFKHKICHFVLPYSNWENGSCCKTESLISLKKGLKESLEKLGKAPYILQTDNTSAATHLVGRDNTKRDFNEEYTTILSHYKMQPKRINIDSPNENGDVESKNGHLKNMVNQQLLLRDNRDFCSNQEYEEFLQKVFEKSNKNKQEKLKEELACMQPLPEAMLPDYQEYDCYVHSSSTVRIKKVTYSVPSRLIGTTLRAHVYETHINLYYGGENLLSLIRIHGDRGGRIDYRHVIYNLLRKPGAFMNYKFKDELFPTINFRKLYDLMSSRYCERNASIEYLRVLKLAAENSEADVDAAIMLLLEDGGIIPTQDKIWDLLDRKAIAADNLIEFKPDLTIYDELFLTERRNYAS